MKKKPTFFPSAPLPLSAPVRSSAGLMLCGLLLSLNPLAAQTTRVWTGAAGDGIFATDANWNPVGLPLPEDELTIATGEATNTGNLNRGGATTVSGTGSLVVSGGRFLNGSGFPAQFNVNNGGRLTHTGEYFIASINNPGDIIQTGGAVNSAVTVAWFLSDGANAKGTYELNGGTLDVTLDGASGLDRQVHLGKQSNGDLLHINGGTATFTAISANRRFYLSRASTLQIDSGAMTASNFFYFILGRELADNTNSSLIVNGGSLTVADTPAGGAFIIGAPNDGVFRLNGGTVDIKDAPMWVSDGANRAGTVFQKGGSISLGTGDVILSRAGSGNGHYQMSGGTLSANNIYPGAGNTPAFVFQGGEIRLNGDQTAVVNEPWFHTAATTTATYDANTDRTTLKAVPPVGKTSTFRYYRFTASKLRDGFSTAVQLSEFEFLKGGASLDRSAVSVTNPDGDNSTAEPAENLLDGDDTTKWLDALNKPLVFDFGTPTAIDGYRFTTGNDATGRDPLRWVLEGSADGNTWTAIDRVVTDAPVPMGRRISLLDQPLPTTVPPQPEPPASLVWTGALSADWNTTQLNWTADGGPVLWSNGKPLEAVFATAGPKAVRVATPVTANSLNFTAAGYTINGTETLTLAEPARVTASATGGGNVTVPVTGTSGLRKEGAGTVTFSGPMSQTGLAALTDGTVVLAEGSSSTGNGNLVLADPANSRALLKIDGTAEYNFSGSVRVGRGDASAAAIIQSEGIVTVGGSGVEYLQLGGGVTNPNGSYGAYVLTGGTLSSSPAGPSGIRIGDFGNGVFLQTGGVLNCARWFALGGNGNSLGDGVASFLGGEATIASGYRILIGDRAGSTSAVNLGTQAGGSAFLTTLNTAGLGVAPGGSALSSELNLNAGTLTLGGPIFRAAGGAATAVNANGATIIAGIGDVALFNDTLGQVNLLKGGLTIDTAGNNATGSASLTAPEGMGVYPAGGAFAVTNGGAGYLAPPLVTVFSSGGGYGTSAIAEVTNGVITRVLLTAPGQGHQAGDQLTFAFNGGGATTIAPEFVKTLAAADVSANNTGGLTKIGEGKFTLNASLSYTGATRVQEGAFEANGSIDGTSLTVSTGATLTGNITGSASARIEGTLAPGSGIGHIDLGALTLAAGSTLAIELGDWTQGSGSGHDSISAASLAIQATTASKLHLTLDSTLLTGFTETARSLTIATSVSAITGLTAGTWQIDAPGFPGTGTWALSATGGNLILAYTPGSSGGTGYTTWAGQFPGFTDTASNSDPDRDGVPNLLEYALAGNPTQASAAILPAATVTPTGFEFTFTRLKSSTADTTQVFEYGNTLGAWTPLTLPASTAGNITVTPNTPSTGIDTIRITLPASAAVNGRLFGRLRVTK